MDFKLTSALAAGAPWASLEAALWVCLFFFWVVVLGCCFGFLFFGLFFVFLFWKAFFVFVSRWFSLMKMFIVCHCHVSICFNSFEAFQGPSFVVVCFLKIRSYFEDDFLVFRYVVLILVAIFSLTKRPGFSLFLFLCWLLKRIQ